MQERDVPTQIWSTTYTQIWSKKSAEMRFFFCTHARLYDLPTPRPTLWGRPPRWQLGNSKIN